MKRRLDSDTNMKYIIQKRLKTKMKDVGIYHNMLDASRAADALGLRFEGTSYIGIWPTYSDGKGGTYRIMLEHESGLVCSPSKDDLAEVGK